MQKKVGGHILRKPLGLLDTYIVSVAYFASFTFMLTVFVGKKISKS